MSEYFYTKKEAEKAILVGVALQSENISYDMMCEYLDELAFLAETAGAETVKIFTQNLDKPVTATFVGKGKLEEIKTYVEDNDIDLIIFDDELSPTQIRNLERELKGRDERYIDLKVFLCPRGSPDCSIPWIIWSLYLYIPRFLPQGSRWRKLLSK